MKYIRTCQSCGKSAEYPEPKRTDKTADGLTDAFCNKKCKSCKSESLDLGSHQPSTPEEIAAQIKFMESYEAD
jgi:hypothetical protein